MVLMADMQQSAKERAADMQGRERAELAAHDLTTQVRNPSEI